MACGLVRLLRHLLVGVSVLLAGCGSEPPPPGGSSPVEAVARLNTHVLENDLAGFARSALPPELYAQLDAAWSSGHTRWPLDELPFASQYPEALAALSAEDAETEWMQVFDRELAGSERDMQQAVLLMSMFMTQFIQQQGDVLYSEHERAHYSQLITAFGQWAASAPLADRARAAQALDLMIPAAREAGLGSAAAFAEAGMEGALNRLAPVIAAGKHSLALYGLDLDVILAEARLQRLKHSGDDAEVELRYRLGGHDITAVIPVQQIDGRWYVSDFIRHARDAVNAAESQ